MPIELKRKWRRVLRWTSLNEGVWGVVGLFIAILASILSSMMDYTSSKANTSSLDRLDSTLDSTQREIRSLKEITDSSSETLDMSLKSQTELIELIRRLDTEMITYQSNIQKADRDISDGLTKMNVALVSLKKAIIGNTESDNSLADHIRRLTTSGEIQADSAREFLSRVRSAIDAGNTLLQGIQEQVERPSIVLSSVPSGRDLNIQYPHSGKYNTTTAVMWTKATNGESYNIEFSIEPKMVHPTKIYILIPNDEESPLSEEQQSDAGQCEIYLRDRLLEVKAGNMVLKASDKVRSGYDAYLVPLGKTNVTLVLQRMDPIEERQPFLVENGDRYPTTLDFMIQCTGHTKQEQAFRYVTISRASEGPRPEQMECIARRLYNSSEMSPSDQ